MVGEKQILVFERKMTDKELFFLIFLTPPLSLVSVDITFLMTRLDRAIPVMEQTNFTVWP